MSKKEAYTAIHETMEALHEIGAVDKQTMRQFDELCLSPIIPITPKKIRALRERENLSQPVFAHHLNVSKNWYVHGNAE
ncbi:TPA: helix-turn-helix domain-containing protein [Salmonella enterica subsp. enterica serovar Muenchen]